MIFEQKLKVETAHNLFTEKYLISRKPIGNGEGCFDPLIKRTIF